MPRARDLGILFDGDPGAMNAITDIPDIRVGHVTLISGDGKLQKGTGPVRTGVTAILPRGQSINPVFAGWYALNGNGEMTGTAWIEESGFLEGPVMITNTHSVGVVRDAVVAWTVEKDRTHPLAHDFSFSLPVVAETYDGRLNDINGFHVKKAHVIEALNSAASGPVAEGSVGGGTGMICHGFKGGIGTSSRMLDEEQGGYTIGVLVQANHGARKNLTISGVPVGLEITDLLPEIHTETVSPGTGSIIVVVATDAPLLPHQLKRLARRVPLGIARLGGMGANGSGDIFIAFSTANPDAARRKGISRLDMVSNEQMNPLFEATVFATEEAIVNALVAAETMKGINGNTVHKIPHDRLMQIMAKYNR